MTLQEISLVAKGKLTMTTVHHKMNSSKQTYCFSKHIIPAILKANLNVLVTFSFRKNAFFAICTIETLMKYGFPSKIQIKHQHISSLRINKLH